MSKTLGYETVMMCATDAPVNIYGRLQDAQGVHPTMSEALPAGDERADSLAKPLSRLAQPVGRK